MIITTISLFVEMLPTPKSEDCHYFNVNWPTVDSVGWFDLFGNQQVDAFLNRRKLSDSTVRDKHVLIVDPLGHCSLADGMMPTLMTANTASMSVGAELAGEFFSGVTDGPVRSRLGRVNLFIMRDFSQAAAGSYWASLDEFPSPQGQVMYMRSEGKLTSSPPSTAGSAQYVYNPETPTPMLGGNNLPGVGTLKSCGTVDQISRENRSDLVLFDSESLDADLPIVGQIKATMYISTDVVDTDFVVTVSDLSDSSSMLVSHGCSACVGDVVMRQRVQHSSGTGLRSTDCSRPHWLHLSKRPPPPCFRSLSCSSILQCKHKYWGL